jgi:predicted DNA binding protein
MGQSGETLTELEFQTADASFPFVDGSDRESCRCVLRQLLPRSDGEYLEFFEVRDGSPEALERAVADAEGAEARVVEEREETGLVVVRVRESRRCIATTVADEGAFLRELRAVDGEGRVVAGVPPSRDPAAVVETVSGTHTSVDLVAKRDQPTSGSLFVNERFRTVIDQRLTDRQREVLVIAYFGGYFERPRGTTGADLAERLDISPATFSQHLRAAQRKVFGAALEDGFSTVAAEIREEFDFEKE